MENKTVYYKLSNHHGLNRIESFTGLKFIYPELYAPTAIFDGMNEESLPIITSDNTATIQLGIWGLLPQNYKEEWQTFQGIRNTLNLDIRNLEQGNRHLVSLNDRRCAVLVSGFFTSYTYCGQLYPLYVFPRSRKPFYLAGVFNSTLDGFVTFSVLLERSNTYISKVHNVCDTMPIVLDNEHKEIWLDPLQYQGIVKGHNTSFKELEFTSHTIAKEFYKNNILFDSILEPAIYKDLVINS